MSDQPRDPRERLLATAGMLFYAVGIHAVGVERLVSEAKVTRATFYRHFPGKDDLVVAYLEAADQAIRAQTAQAAASGLPPAEILREVGRALAADIRAAGFRGCAFLNAAAEYPAPDHPVHQAVLRHRAWFLAAVTDLFAGAGADEDRVDDLGRHFVMLRDGVMAAGYLGDPVAAGTTFLAGIDGLLSVDAVAGRQRPGGSGREVVAGR